MAEVLMVDMTRTGAGPSCSYITDRRSHLSPRPLKGATQASCLGGKVSRYKTAAWCLGGQSCSRRHHLRTATRRMWCAAAALEEEVVQVDGEVTNERIPVTVITGFLGSGKTTLLNALLRQDHGRRIAVIENEFGAIDIDSELVAFKESLEGSDQQIMMLNNGCLCCTVKDDLLDMLEELVARRDSFDHVVIETTGLANPAPIIETFVAFPPVADHYSLDGVLTLVDAAHVMRHLDEAKPEGVVNEALAQVAYADRIILNKTDLVSAPEADAVQARLAAINNAAQVLRTRQADVSADYVLGIGGFDLSRIGDEVVDEQEAAHAHSHDHDHGHSSHHHEHEHGREHQHAGEAAAASAHGHEHSHEAHSHEAHGHNGHGHEEHGHAGHDHSHTHDDSVTSVSLELDGDLDLDKLNDWMEDLIFSCADDLFRYKGVLAIAGWPDRFIFQGVHAVFDGTPGKPWREGDRHRSKMVFIGRELDESVLRAGFAKCLA